MNSKGRLKDQDNWFSDGLCSYNSGLFFTHSATEFSAFGEKFTQHSGILQLMDDLGDALKSDKPVNMLGGGNPARIAEVNAVFADVFSKLAAEHAVENIGNYSNPQGDAALIVALTEFLNREYGWNLTADNIALTNGSQNAFDALESLPELKEGKIGAICCSRPTNPTGNVLTDGEMARLDALAQEHGIPLIIDNAYGMPFPNIIYSDVTLNWHENIILCFSFSKIGLPGVRTGIIVAAPEVVKAVSSLNAIVNLSPTRFGAAIAAPLLNDGRLKQLADQVIQPFYRRQAQTAVSLLKRELGAYPLKIHKPEGAIFLWLWFENLPVSSQTLYEMLKAEGTLIIPGEHFFVGIDTQDYPHAHECIRMSIAQDAETLEKGIAAIGRVVRGLYDKK